ncbi:5'-3' exoribonuclease, partial [Thalictrum thalictroides]
AICKLPFIEESRLLAEIARVEHTLTDEEKRRNSIGMDILFVHVSHPLGADIIVFCERNKDHPKLAQAKIKRRIDPKFSGGMNGFMYLSDRPAWPLEINSSIEGMEKITMNKVISVFYKYPTSHPHIPRPPEGVVIPMRSVRKADIVPASKLWHEKSAVLERLQSDRPVPKSISSSCLAKLARRLVYEYYAERMKENVDPSVIDGLITTDVPSCLTKPNSRETFDNIMMYGVSSVSGTKPKKKGSEGTGTKQRKRKRSLGGSVDRRQENGEPSILARPITTNAVSFPIQPNLNKRAKPDGKESVSTEPGNRKRKRKAAAKKRPAVLGGDIAVDAPPCPTMSVEEKMDIDNLPNTTEPAKNINDAADTKHDKRSRRRRAARENKKENMEPVRDGHVALAAVDNKNINDTADTKLTKRGRRRKAARAARENKKENMELVHDGHVALAAGENKEENMEPVHDGHIALVARENKKENTYMVPVDDVHIALAAGENKKENIYMEPVHDGHIALAAVENKNENMEPVHDGHIALAAGENKKENMECMHDGHTASAAGESKKENMEPVPDGHIAITAGENKKEHMERVHDHGLIALAAAETKGNMEPVHDGHFALTAGENKKETMEPVLDGHIALDAPSLPTHLNSRDGL